VSVRTLLATHSWSHRLFPQVQMIGCCLLIQASGSISLYFGPWRWAKQWRWKPQLYLWQRTWVRVGRTDTLSLRWILGVGFIHWQLPESELYWFGPLQWETLWPRITGEARPANGV
jgi:hypothetical protein